MSQVWILNRGVSPDWYLNCTDIFFGGVIMKKIKYIIFTIIFLLPFFTPVFGQTVTPEISDITPDRGKVGDTIVINGSGFGTDGKIFFGDIEGTVISWNDNMIIGAISLGSSSGTIEIVTPAGSVKHKFTVLPSWNVYFSPAKTVLSAVAFRNPRDGWVMEKNTQGNIYHFNGKQWESADIVKTSNWIGDIAFLSSGKGWAVGGTGTILYFNGKKWERVGDEVTGDDLNDVFFISPTNGWAVGGEGRILHYYDWTVQDVSWKKEAKVPTFDTLNAVYFISPDKGWAMGRDGVILEYNKNKWVKIASPSGSVIYSIGFASKNNGWAVGANGTILQYNGRAWVSFPSPVTENLNTIFMISDKDGWIGGDTGTLLHYNGKTWQIVNSPAKSNILDLYFVAPDDGWAVGEEGIILRYH